MDGTALSLGLVEAGLWAKGTGRGGLPLGWAVAFAALAMVLYVSRGAYGSRLHDDLIDDVRLRLSQVFLAAVGVLAASSIIAVGSLRFESLLWAWFFASVFVALSRGAWHLDLRYQRSRHEALSPTLIVGSGKVGATVARRLLERPEFGLAPVGYLDDEPLLLERGPEIDVLGGAADLERVVAEHEIEKVIFTFSRLPHEAMLELTERCHALGVELSVVPRLFEMTPARKLEVRHFGGLPVLHLRPARPDGWYFRVKYALDRINAALLLLLAAPVLLPIALAVRRSLGRPILFRQTRVGLDGRRFELLKFRTMRDDETETVPNLPDDTAPGGVEGDDRRSMFGKFLRSTSLDELPQLLNVLRGEMSLIGPRPERPEYVDLFTAGVHNYARRHRVRPGITGWAQVHGLRGQTSISDRAEWDNYYIENFSLWLDVKILLLTISALLSCAPRREGETPVTPTDLQPWPAERAARPASLKPTLSTPIEFATMPADSLGSDSLPVPHSSYGHGPYR